MKKFLWLGLALVVMIIGFAVSRALHLSEFASFGVAVCPALLAAFPFLKRWMPQISFTLWVLTVALIALFYWLLHFAFARLGWS